ncbi:sensor histidine kinase [Paenibacillus alvei]|uniref:cache domain-containing sensor histidine kinase n=1 Tax=Paenibacillus alvei TaxID=44250 RepID=UPI00227FBED7|nr:sensor histidine kinase [Paenibacillus alvei]MCY7484256.1 sensor histidine kinase [Paenibacillus alvei]MCY9541785.1 sensor histidine kinase [Paenibacillus alvei]MCY9705028.1 sensor histidine kinase [Paenibacillus alvei]MCY9734704.1 sensor histidine kinase [Paenibacillus alvei]MCY9753973.1 sensor histidine kinase [Paenibacillus alvei]
MLKYVRNQIRQRIQWRLTIYFVLILIPLLLTGWFSNKRSQELLLSETTARTESAMHALMDNIELVLQNVEELSAMLSTDTEMNEALTHAKRELKGNDIMAFADMKHKLSNFLSIHPMFSQIAVYHDHSNSVISTLHGVLPVDRANDRIWLRQLLNGMGTGIVFIQPDERIGAGKPFGQAFGADSLAVVRAMDIYNPNRERHALIISLNMARLQQYIRSVTPSPQAELHLYTADGKWVTGTAERPQSYQDYMSRAEASDHVLIQAASPYYGWTLTLSQPKKELFAQSYQLEYYAVFMIVLSIVLALVMAYSIYTSIAAPMRKLARGMRAITIGKLDVRLNSNRQDEFGLVTDLFNHMASQQQHLIHDHYEQSLRLANTELKLLQSQIHPHFLYNTLDSIYWMAQHAEAEDISEMVLHLSRFFRLSLSKGRDVLTVKECLEHLHAYIRIQQIRFMDLFRIEYEVEPQAEGIPLVKLLVQPVVENAIIHGLEKSSQAEEMLLRIAVRVEEKEGGRCLIIAIIDSGTGMTEDVSLRLQAELSAVLREPTEQGLKVSNQAGSGYGLRNVAARMRLNYGPRAHIHISSVPGEGTTVTLVLPLSEPYKSRAGVWTEAAG